MTIELNGERVEIGTSSTVATAFAQLGADGERRGVAVAVDGEVVPRSAWEDTPLSEGQKVEILGAMQGG
jgi:sulfur carrier protein